MSQMYILLVLQSIGLLKYSTGMINLLLKCEDQFLFIASAVFLDCTNGICPLDDVVYAFICECYMSHFTYIYTGFSKIYSNIITAIISGVVVIVAIIIVLIVAFIVTKRLHRNTTHQPYSNDSISTSTVHDVCAGTENPLFNLKSCKNSAYGIK